MLTKIFIFLFTIGMFFSVPSEVSAKPNLETAIFAGGCFWCMEPPFEKLDGVTEVTSGYTGGHVKNPTYKDVSSGLTGHVESVRITYDPARISYSKLLEVFWMQINPTDPDGQFIDRGKQYASGIFYANDEQRKLAEESKAELARSGRFSNPIVTPIIKATEFYPAEEYHQDFYKNHSIKYRFYTRGSGRTEFLDKAWGEERKMAIKKEDERYKKPSDEELKKMLTPLQYKVTQKEGTEKAFDNEYWDNKREGIYVDIVSGEPLFSSKEKFESETGWPSFTKPLAPENIVEKEDRRLFTKRIEVRSKYADSHLGHVFNDGPPPTGLRYCMNSAALRFIPKEDLEKEGYKEYAKLFER